MKTKQIKNGRIYALENTNKYGVGIYDLETKYLRNSKFIETNKTSKIKIIEEIDWFNPEKWRTANKSSTISQQDENIVINFSETMNMIHYEGFILDKDYSFVIRIKLTSEGEYSLGITNRTSFQQFSSGTFQGYHVVEYSFPDCLWYLDGFLQGSIPNYVWFGDNQHVYFKNGEGTEEIIIKEISVDTFRTLPIYSTDYNPQESPSNWEIIKYGNNELGSISQMGAIYSEDGTESPLSMSLKLDGRSYFGFNELLPVKYGELEDGTIKVTLYLDRDDEMYTYVAIMWDKKIPYGIGLRNYGLKGKEIHTIELRIYDKQVYFYVDNQYGQTIDLSLRSADKYQLVILSEGRGGEYILSIMKSPFVQNIPLE